LVALHWLWAIVGEALEEAQGLAYLIDYMDWERSNLRFDLGVHSLELQERLLHLHRPSSAVRNCLWILAAPSVREPIRFVAYLWLGASDLYL